MHNIGEQIRDGGSGEGGLRVGVIDNLAYGFA